MKYATPYGSSQGVFDLSRNGKSFHNLRLTTTLGLEEGTIHATVNGRVTLCSTPISQPLTLNSPSMPDKREPVCKFCKKADEEERRYR